MRFRSPRALPRVARPGDRRSHHAVIAPYVTASGTPPAWLEPWWRMALLKLALAVLALLPALLILQWLRDGRNSRTAYQALLSELKSTLKEPSVGGTVSFEIKAE